MKSFFSNRVIWKGLWPPRSAEHGALRRHVSGKKQGSLIAPHAMQSFTHTSRYVAHYYFWSRLLPTMCLGLFRVQSSCILITTQRRATLENCKDRFFKVIIRLPNFTKLNQSDIWMRHLMQWFYFRIIVKVVTHWCFCLLSKAVNMLKTTVYR